jgi:BolA protein
MDRVAWLERTLRLAFAPEHLEVVDESDRHAGHSGAGSGGHFRVVIVSGHFRKQDLLSRQRAVYAALGAGMQSEVHALSLRTLTPEEWAAKEQ